MSRDRADLTEWLIHFVHRRNPEHDLYDEERPLALPLHANPRLVEKFDRWTDRDTYGEHELEPDAYAISVLQRILADGHLRSSWSIRNGRPTIYGPRPAVCFTEMPLGALVEYARDRGDEGKVAPFGIAIRRDEAFEAGARPVIYGLSTPHREVDSKEIWPRYLHPRCGIAKDEQYRYVATKLGKTRIIDWMHEREWRWSDVRDELEVPGLALWLVDAPTFSKVLLIVEKRSDVPRLLDQLQTMYDAERDEYDIAEYSREAIERTRVLALEDIPEAAGTSVRIDDLHLNKLAKASAAVPDVELVKKVKAALAAARQAATDASEAKDYHDSHGTYGFADVVNSSPRSSVAQALLSLDAASPHPQGYVLWGLTRGLSASGMLDRAEAASQAARDVLEKAFPDDEWWVWSRVD